MSWSVEDFNGSFDDSKWPVGGAESAQPKAPHFVVPSAPLRGRMPGIQQHTLAKLRQDGELLAFDQRAVRQILTIAVRQIEGDEAPFPTPE